MQCQNEKLIEYANFNSHKLRSPVSTILGLLDLIKQDPNEEDLNDCINLLDKSTKQLDQLVHDAQNLLQDAKFIEEPNVVKK